MKEKKGRTGLISLVQANPKRVFHYFDRTPRSFNLNTISSLLRGFQVIQTINCK